MELLIPIAALGGLYYSTQKKENFKPKEGFTDLPNTNIPNKNYPQEYPTISTDTELTSRLSTVNKFDQPQVYTDKYFTPSKPEIAKGASYQSMNGQRVGADYFQHNNMVPFFGAKNRTVVVDSNSSESILDNYSGSGTHVIKKSEQSPLFTPGENLQYANGAPNQNDFYQSRVNPSQRMANVKPFQEQHVGPGLGLGYTTEGSGGYNSGLAMREKWMDKTVDELRTDNHQRASGIGLFGHEGPANSMIKNLGSIGQVEKNRVTRTFDMGPERYFTTTGVEKKPTLRAIPVDRYVNRPETSASYVGVASAPTPEMYNNSGEFMKSKHMDLGPLPLGVANATHFNEVTSNDYEINAKRAYPNNRTSNTQDTYFGAFSGAIGAVIAPLLDELRPSRKENVIGNLRLYENAYTKNGSTYLFNPGDRPNTTIRETTEENRFISGVNANQNGGGYMTNEYQPISNQRDSTTDVFYSGAASSAAKQLRPYDAEYRQRNNDIKSSTIEGRMVPGNMSLMNNNISMRVREGERLNQRPLVKTSGPQEFISADTIGDSHTKQGLYSTIQMDRNSPEILDAFRKNPYTHSLTNIA